MSTCSSLTVRVQRAEARQRADLRPLERCVRHRSSRGPQLPNNHRAADPGHTSNSGPSNSRNSMGAPFSTMNATVTPLLGLLARTRISLPAMASSRSLTTKATCGTAFTSSGNGASASNRIHSTPNLLASNPDTNILNLSRYTSPSRGTWVGIPTW